MARSANEPPVIAPKDGLRQRQRADGSWRLWWEPTKRQREAGAKNVEFHARQPGHAQREATRLMAAWSAQADGKAPPARRDGRSISALIAEYRASRFYTQLRPTSQRSYDTDLRAIETKWGPEPVALFDTALVDQWYDSLLAAKGAFRAGAIIGMLRRIMQLAERRGWRPRGTNPARDMEITRPGRRRRVGTWDELNALLHAALTLARQGGPANRITYRGMRLAIMLTVLAGQRQTDVRDALPTHFQRVVLQLPGMDKARGFWIWSLTRSKRLNEGQLALHTEIIPPLRLQLKLAADGPGTLIWDEATRQPLSKRLFFDRWDAIRQQAAIEVPSVTTLQWRDLRRTFSNLSRAGGADRGDVADVLGNTAATDDTLALVYMAPQIATTWRAASAISRPPKASSKPKERKKA